MAKYKIPQLLLQINMAFNYDGSFGEYEAFVVSIEDFTYTFLRAVASPQYIRSLRGQPANGSLKVSRSKLFNIVDRGVQMELLRGLMALDRYLVQRPEFSFPMQTVVRTKLESLPTANCNSQMNMKYLRAHHGALSNGKIFMLKGLVMY